MFGKSDWFVSRDKEHSTRPTTWQGHVYLASWFAACVAPAIYLSATQLVPESVIWLLVSLLAFAWDWRSMWRQEGSSVRSGSQPMTVSAPPIIGQPHAAVTPDIVFIDRPASQKPLIRRAYEYYLKR